MQVEFPLCAGSAVSLTAHVHEQTEGLLTPHLVPVCNVNLKFDNGVVTKLSMCWSGMSSYCGDSVLVREAYRFCTWECFGLISRAHFLAVSVIILRQWEVVHTAFLSKETDCKYCFRVAWCLDRVKNLFLQIQWRIRLCCNFFSPQNSKRCKDGVEIKYFVVDFRPHFCIQTFFPFILYKEISMTTCGHDHYYEFLCEICVSILLPRYICLVPTTVGIIWNVRVLNLAGK